MCVLFTNHTDPPVSLDMCSSHEPRIESLDVCSFHEPQLESLHVCSSHKPHKDTPVSLHVCSSHEPHLGACSSAVPKLAGQRMAVPKLPEITTFRKVGPPTTERGHFEATHLTPAKFKHSVKPPREVNGRDPHVGHLSVTRAPTRPLRQIEQLSRLDVLTTFTNPFPAFP